MAQELLLNDDRLFPPEPAVRAIDRITPRTTDHDRAEAELLSGVVDPALVVTEPFSEWVLSGEFCQGRPAWDSAGAQFVDDVEPFELRKLLLLNGSHSLLAYAGPVIGHETVYDAICDDTVRGWVEQWWDDAATQVPLSADEVASYRAALLARFANPKIRHLLKQIAMDGSMKIPIRIVRVLKAVREQEDRVATGATRAIAAWILHLMGEGAPINDPTAEELLALISDDPALSVAHVLGYLGICDDTEIEATVLAQLDEIRAAKTA